MTDQDGQADWEIFYTPGPRARAQYTFFTNRQKTEVIELSEPEVSLALPESSTSTDAPFTEALIKRGISPAQAKKILVERRPDDELFDVLEWATT